MHVKRIHLALPLSSSYDRAVLHGILSYCQTHGEWEFWYTEQVNSQTRSGRMAKAVKMRGIQGIIVDLWNPEILGRLTQLGVPVVEVSGTAGCPPPGVHVDNTAVGAMAAQHLLEKGLSHFGFIGWSSAQHSEARKIAFTRTLEQAGCPCDILILPSPSPERLAQIELRMRTWLQSLPKPVGVFAWFDYVAREAVYACRESGLRVPQDVAVVGADNDELSCILSPTPISSIDVNAIQIGYEAARLLDRLISGRRPPAGPILVKPRGVVMRRSTDTIANAKPEVILALQFMREHASEGICVSDVLRKVAISRRTLEIELSRLLGRSPLQHIRHERVQRAKSLLLGTDLSVLAIARSCGFRSATLFCRVYKSLIGSSPAQFRAKHRTPSLEGSAPAGKFPAIKSSIHR